MIVENMANKIALIAGKVHSLEVGQNVASKAGSGVRYPKLHDNRMEVSSRKQRNWPVSKTRVLYRLEVTANATRQEESKDKSNDKDGSYLGMWKRAMENQKSSSLPESGLSDGTNDEGPEALERKSKHFEKIQQVPVEERDRAQTIQVVDRAAAAIAAAKALLAQRPLSQHPSTTLPSAEDSSSNDGNSRREGLLPDTPNNSGDLPEGKRTQLFVSSSPQSEIGHNTPGPDFWSWSPPSANEGENMPDLPKLQPEKGLSAHGNPVADVLEKEKPSEALVIPFESTVMGETTQSPEASLIFQSRAAPSLPPLQSLMEVGNVSTPDSTIPVKEDISELRFDSAIPERASEIASIMERDHETSGYATHGVNPDGSRWWKETGIEHRMNGVVFNWTMTRGVSSNGAIEWEEKFWEACDQFDYKELGSEKSGRDAAGNVWREYWKEAMWQDMKTGLVHIEKTADKWAKNGNNEQWQEKWWEHYDAAGHADKWADKWCQIDPNTPLEAGHAHIWHERWGEKYDGKGGAMKYTDKWAERAETENRWAKWGDKWDEHFNKNSHGVRQGETWWEGATGERWNRTWGEGHDGSGWIHKYGKSSSGEHWDTHEEQDTWYERYPHYGFHHCLQNSVELRRVGKQTKPKL